MHDTLVIMAGGMSSRMKRAAADSAVQDADAAQADSKDKGLIGVGTSNRPLLDYLLYNAREAGYKRVIIVTGMDNSAMKALYGHNDADNAFHGLSISYVIQPIPEGRSKPYGTADAIFRAMIAYPELQTEAFTCCNSDNLYTLTALRLLRETDALHAWINYDRAGLDFPGEKIGGFALTITDSDGYLEGMVEKPDPRQIENYADRSGSLRVSMNVFKLTGLMAFPYIRDCPLSKERQEKELPAVVLTIGARHPRTVLGIPLKEHVPDLTEKADIARVREYLSKNNIDLDW
ncbi:MAG: NTP transferase domain-containing protein [Candidatus Marinimicrobia bacterium]|nr:NTP transferase domain-containing protein [Candidatus Neomarinimicrobiota bacterium]